MAPETPASQSEAPKQRPKRSGGAIDRLRAYMVYVVNQHHMTHRQRSDSKYIGRGSDHGNPFKITHARSRECSIRKYLELVHRMKPQDRAVWLRSIATTLRLGRKLRCYCAPQDCHGMILAAYAINGPEMEDYWRQFGDRPTLHLQPVGSSEYTRGNPRD